MTEVIYDDDQNNIHLVCDCGHERVQHLFGVGCHVKTDGVRCHCERYSQKHLRTSNETPAQYTKRTQIKIEV